MCEKPQTLTSENPAIAFAHWLYHYPASRKNIVNKLAHAKFPADFLLPNQLFYILLLEVLGGGKMTCLKSQKGVVLIICMIFLCIFTALAVSLAAMSGTNLQIAANYHKVNRALESAQSGVEVLRFWLDGIYLLGTVPANQRLNPISSYLHDNLINGISNIDAIFNSTNTITISPVTLDSENSQSFNAVIEKTTNDNILRLRVTGHYGPVTRTIAVLYNFQQRGNTVFDFGVATKGPLLMTGNIELEGVNIAVEASVYIEAQGAATALDLTGKCSIAGNVSIVDPVAAAQVSNASSIGGDKGTAAEQHVIQPVPPSEFPFPNPGLFEQYVGVGSEHIVTSGSNQNITLENVKIPAGVNPTFSGNVTIRGIVFIETPNVVTFTGNTTVTGIIAGDGDLDDNSGTNQVNILGTVVSHPVTDLPAESQFAQLRDEKGTFMITPGFSVSFGGNFNTLNGTIAANGVEFFGNAGGIINGSIVNYSPVPMTLSGNSDLSFNRSGITQSPAGFTPELRLEYDPNSYSEIVL